MSIDATVLQAERTRLQGEVNSLSQQIASMNGEIKAHLQALGITEADVAKTAENAQTALAQAEQEFNQLYAAYEQYKAQIAVPVTQPEGLAFDLAPQA